MYCIIQNFSLTFASLPITPSNSKLMCSFRLLQSNLREYFFFFGHTLLMCLSLLMNITSCQFRFLMWCSLHSISLILIFIPCWISRIETFLTITFSSFHIPVYLSWHTGLFICNIISIFYRHCIIVFFCLSGVYEAFFSVNVSS